MTPILTALLFLLAFPLSAGHGQTPPVPPSKQERIGDLDQKLESQKQQKSALHAKITEINEELEQTKERSVTVARSIQNNEKTLRNLDEKIKNLQQQEEGLRAKLEKDKHAIARLIMALQRLRRMPPEAMIARPETPLKAAQSALLLKEIIPALDKQAKILRTNLSELQTVTRDLENQKEQQLAAMRDLKNEHQKLSVLVDKKEKLYETTNKDLKVQEQKVQQISLQAKNLEDLVTRLDENRARKSARALSRKAVLTQPQTRMPAAGTAQLPVSGIIRTAYGQPDSYGAPSHGLTIEGRAGALIVAPMGGKIVFAGHFKNYGNMVIVEHKGGFHSLIAGLEKIDTVVGHSVNAGEPLGFLHGGSADIKPALYYELRRNGKSVNPAEKFADLG